MYRLQRKPCKTVKHKEVNKTGSRAQRFYRKGKSTDSSEMHLQNLWSALNWHVEFHITLLKKVAIKKWRDTVSRKFRIPMYQHRFGIPSN